MGKTTREDILRVATEIFKEKGFQRASMRDIAGKIGINQGSLYNFFSSKEAIFYQIAKDTMDDSLRIFKKITKEDVAPLEEIKVIIKNHIKLLCSRLEEITILLHDFRGLNEDHQREMIEKRRVFERYIEEVLIEGVNKGIFQIKDTKMATYALLGMDNWIYQWYSPDGKFKPEGMAELFIELFLKGILKDKKMKEYKKLFTPFKIGHLRLQNRVTMAPFFTGYGNKNGTVSKKLLEHHRRIAR
ncbi:MAG: TetR family transcriptional regulator, partial [Thermodesulfobacteriota bacterium]|nr:TetR family transcriptional regulator [Thermodesulfobacteriota bacterium]